MNNSMNNPHPFAVTAVYTDSRIPHFAGNPLIEALPPTKTEGELVNALLSLPPFEPEQRDWPTNERIQMLGTLTSFMLPMPKHFKLCYALDSMLRRGYVNRAPRTAGHAQVSQDLYQMQQRVVCNPTLGATKQPAFPTNLVLAPAISTALIGLSGMGKTTLVRRFCAQLPSVIHHPDTNTYQIPTLHIELPADGANIKGLATAIIVEIERRIPGSNYMKTYTTGRLSEERLIHSAAHLMHLHVVGLLICDEVQNLCNSKKKSEILMTQLVSLCNVSRLPILWIGTNKASQVLSADFRQARRSTGEGIAPWGRMLPGGDGEWEQFLETLWQYQWVRKPAVLTDDFKACMYLASQGVIDVAIRFFIACQCRAIMDETEELTLELMSAVYEEEFKLLHPMLGALESQDLEELSKFDDIAPFDWKEQLEATKAKIEARSSPLYKVKTDSKSFEARIVGSLTSAGIPWELASDALAHVLNLGKSMTLVEALPVAWAYLTNPTPVKRPKKSSAKPVKVQDPAQFDDNPDDLRRAFAHAKDQGRSTSDLLDAMGFAPEVEELI